MTLTSAVNTLSRIRRANLRSNSAGLVFSAVCFSLSGFWLLSTSASKEVLDSSGTYVTWPISPWNIIWPLISAVAVMLIGLRLSSSAYKRSLQKSIAEARAVLLDHGLLSVVLLENAYELLPSLGKKRRVGRHLPGFAQKRPSASPVLRQSFDQRMQDLLSNWNGLKKDMRWDEYGWKLRIQEEEELQERQAAAAKSGTEHAEASVFVEQPYKKELLAIALFPILALLALLFTRTAVDALGLTQQWSIYGPSFNGLQAVLLSLFAFTAGMTVTKASGRATGRRSALLEILDDSEASSDNEGSDDLAKHAPPGDRVKVQILNG